jgi:hypothetical protein
LPTPHHKAVGGGAGVEVMKLLFDPGVRRRNWGQNALPCSMMGSMTGG